MKPTKRGSGGRPTKEQSEGIDAAVLDGARLLFAKNGIAHTSIDEISSTLRVSKHTIYRRYRNKSALLEAVVDRDVVYFREELRSAGADGSNALDALRRIAFRYVEIGRSRDYATFYHSIFAEAARSSEMRSNLAKWSAGALQPLRDTIIQGQEAQLIAGSEPGELFSIFVDLFEGVNNLLRVGEDDYVSTIDWKVATQKRWEVFERLAVR